MSEQMIVQRGLGRGCVRIEGRCPACGVASLFVGEGGYVTCAARPRPDPTAPSAALGVTFPVIHPTDQGQRQDAGAEGEL